MKRQALGKGLNAILPSYGSDDGGQPLNVDIDLLIPNSQQPRLRFQPEALEELAASIRENGILQPIVVRRSDEGRFEIIAGERRWRAAQQAGQPKVPVVVREVPDDKLLELALLENIQREDLNPVEEARAYDTLLREKGYRQEDLANRLGKSRAAVANSVRLLNLARNVQDLLEARTLTAGQARPLLAVEDAALQARLAEAVAKRGLSAREVEKMVDRLKRADDKAEAARAAVDPNVLAAEERLTQFLRAKVRIEKGGKGGKIVIHYTTEDELERLFEEICRLED